MANSDQAQYVLRYNEISGDLEFGSGNNWTPLIITNAGGITALTGDVTAGPGSGSQATTVVSVGGSTAASIHTSQLATAAATSSDTPNTLVLRDSSGNFAAGVISATSLTGTAQPFIFKPTVDSTTALEFTTAGGVVLFKYDSVDGFFGINTGSSSPNRNLSVFGTANVTGNFLAGSITVNTGNVQIEGTSSLASILIAPASLGMLATTSDTDQLLFANGTVWQSLSPNVAATAGTGTITPSAIAAVTLTVPVSGNVTIDGPTGGYDGQKLTFRIVNDGSHSVTFATGAGNFKFGTTFTSYTNSVSLIDYVGVIYNSTASLWHIVSLSQGF